MIDSEAFLGSIKRIVKEKSPSAKVYLYGSRARKVDINENSDWDILILLETKNVSRDDEKEITSPLYDLEFDTGEIISPMVYSYTEWNTKYGMTPFYNNVMKEGKLL